VVSVLESLFGKQLWTGRPLKYLESKYGAPMIDRIIRATPFSAIESTVQGMFDERKSLPMRLGNMLTGFKTSTYDTEKWKLLDAIEQARRELQASPYTRELPIDYIPERFQDIAPEEVQRKLRRKRELERLRSALAVD